MDSGISAQIGLWYLSNMQSQAKTVADYLAGLPEDRRHALEQVRKVIQQNLGKGFEEGMQYGMIGYYVPHSIYPAGYHCKPSEPLPFASLAAQKNHLAFYAMFLYQNGQELERFVKEWKATGKKLDMGKACVRFKKLEDVPLEVIGRAVGRIGCNAFVAAYESMLGPKGKPISLGKPTSSTKQVATEKSNSKKSNSKKSALKKAAAAKKPSTAQAAAGSQAGSRRAATKKPAANRPAAKKPAR